LHIGACLLFDGAIWLKAGRQIAPLGKQEALAHDLADTCGSEPKCVAPILLQGEQELVAMAKHAISRASGGYATDRVVLFLNELQSFQNASRSGREKGAFEMSTICRSPSGLVMKSPGSANGRSVSSGKLGSDRAQFAHLVLGKPAGDGKTPAFLGGFFLGTIKRIAGDGDDVRACFLEAFEQAVERLRFRG
ncbi:MAG: hypothetical protein U5L04_04710, partial [Trueperaceae bacterium]|nr:hypothetical protein [Trueperaceae bacterium]